MSIITRTAILVKKPLERIAYSPAVVYVMTKINADMIVQFSYAVVHQEGLIGVVIKLM